jgi:thiamine-phosphate pyrophosphorylase
LLPFLIARRAAPGGLILSMASHGGQRGAARARRLRPDCLFLSPLFPTQSHPGAPTLGPLRWAGFASRLPGPCIALGGISPARLGRVPRRAAGVAAIGGLAP